MGIEKKNYQSLEQNYLKLKKQKNKLGLIEESWDEESYL